jgi:hypothetical protein
MDAERNQWDYIYDAEALAALKGNRFHKKKNLVNQFKKKHEFVYADIDAELADRAMALQADWCTWRTCEDSAQLAAENLAIMRALQNWNALEGIMGGCISVNDLIVAFTVGEVLQESTLLIHFEKGCPGYKGTYQAINQMFLKQHAKDRIRWVNREADLGDEGLRQAKLSYHPEGFIEKYRIRFPS